LRAMDEVGFLQHIGLMQAIHRRTTLGEEVNVAFLDTGEEKIIHDLARTREVRHDVIESASHFQASSMTIDRMSGVDQVPIRIPAWRRNPAPATQLPAQSHCTAAATLGQDAACASPAFVVCKTTH